MEIKLKLQPLRIPSYVIAQMPPRARQEGMVDSPKFHLRELEPDVLAELCDEFRKNVFAKAEKADPSAYPSSDHQIRGEDMSTETKEEFYDEKISPLVQQIIALCKEKEIPMLADFSLDWSEDAQNFLKCTTIVLDSSWEPPMEMIEAARVLRPTKLPTMTVTERGEDGNVQKITAIL